MTKQRIPETDHGITGEVTVAAYDILQRNLRDKGQIATQALIQSGITRGHALEVGHGPGYLGLEWLKNTSDTRLTGLDISPDMTALAGRNAVEYGLSGRTEYRQGAGNHLPFADNTFDTVFTNGSLHEWSDPLGTFNELARVIKPGSLYFISDLRRDMPLTMQWLMWLSCRPTFIRPYMFTSIHAAYTVPELQEMVKGTAMRGAVITANVVTIQITGKKE